MCNKVRNRVLCIRQEMKHSRIWSFSFSLCILSTSTDSQSSIEAPTESVRHTVLETTDRLTDMTHRGRRRDTRYCSTGLSTNPSRTQCGRQRQRTNEMDEIPAWHAPRNTAANIRMKRGYVAGPHIFIRLATVLYRRLLILREARNEK